MILTHLVILKLIPGAGNGAASGAATPRERIRQGVGVGFCFLLGIVFTASKG